MKLRRKSTRLFQYRWSINEFHARFSGCQYFESVLRNVHNGDRPAFSSGRRPEIVKDFEHSICMALSVCQLLKISY